MWTIILAIVYYVVITPVGWLCRVIHDPLARRWNGDARSYWMTPTVPNRPVDGS